jgi:hypothetical protein
MRLVRSRASLAPVAIPLAGHPLHRNFLRKLPIARLGVNAKLLA